jgi:hypothetical protein
MKTPVPFAAATEPGLNFDIAANKCMNMLAFINTSAEGDEGGYKTDCPSIIRSN